MKSQTGEAKGPIFKPPKILRNKRPNIDLLLGSRNDVSNKFRLDRERRFCYKFSVIMLVFLSLHRYLIDIESNHKHVVVLHILFFCAHAVMCHRVRASKFQLARLSFNHSNGRTHIWRFSTSYKILIRSGSRDTYQQQCCSWQLGGKKCSYLVRGIAPHKNVFQPHLMHTEYKYIFRSPGHFFFWSNDAQARGPVALRTLDDWPITAVRLKICLICYGSRNTGF